MRSPGSLQRRAAALGGAGAGFAQLLERVHLTVTGSVAIVLVAAGWFAARAIGSKTMYLMIYGAALAILLSWLVSRRRLAIQVTRSQLPPRIRVSQMVDVELQISSRRRLTTVLLDEQVPARLGRPVRIPIGSLPSGQTLSHRYALHPTLRGVYQVGPVTATWSDPFGFTRHKQLLPEPVEIIVHPPTETVHDRVLTRMWEDPPVRPPVSKPWPVGFEFYGMRDYVPGDDLRRVVWSVLAKTGRTMVRESEQGITDRVVLVLDTAREWHSPGEVSATFETAIRAVASLGVRHLGEGFGVSLLTNEGRVLSGLRGRRAELTLLDALARLERGSRPLTAAAHLLLEEARGHPHLLLVTPHLDTNAARQLKLIIDRGVSVAVVQVVWEESDFASAGRAAAVGARVVQLEPDTPLHAVFTPYARVGAAR